VALKAFKLAFPELYVAETLTAREPYMSKSPRYFRQTNCWQLQEWSREHVIDYWCEPTRMTGRFKLKATEQPHLDEVVCGVRGLSVYFRSDDPMPHENIIVLPFSKYVLKAKTCTFCVIADLPLLNEACRELNGGTT